MINVSATVAIADTSPPEVCIIIDGKVIGGFDARAALALAAQICDAAGTVDALITAGPPYPTSPFHH